MTETINFESIVGKLDLNCVQMVADRYTERMENVKKAVARLGLLKVTVECNNLLTDKAAEFYVDYSSDPTAKQLLDKLNSYGNGRGSKPDIATTSGALQNRQKAITDELGFLVRKRHPAPLPAPTTTGPRSLWEEIRVIIGLSPTPVAPKAEKNLPSLIDTIVANNPTLKDPSEADAYMPFAIRDMRERNTSAQQK